MDAILKELAAEDLSGAAEQEKPYGLVLCVGPTGSGKTTTLHSRAIQKKSTVDEIRKIALEEGMTTLLQDGVQKAMGGLTDMKQVLAVCSR